MCGCSHGNDSAGGQQSLPTGSHAPRRSADSRFRARPHVIAAPAAVAAGGRRILEPLEPLPRRRATELDGPCAARRRATRRWLPSGGPGADGSGSDHGANPCVQEHMASGARPWRDATRVCRRGRASVPDQQFPRTAPDQLGGNTPGPPRTGRRQRSFKRRSAGSSRSRHRRAAGAPRYRPSRRGR
jgi:hypothetical protein